MKAKELAELLLKNPEFEVKFSFSEIDGTHYGVSVRSFENLQIGDIGYSDRVIQLGGDER